MRLSGEQLRSLLRPLQQFEPREAWNSSELADVLGGNPRIPAAVLVPLIEREHGDTVLLTRRTDELRHHAGQVAFPGGRSEPGDRWPLHTALRETEEETGISEAQIEAMGYLEPFDTITGFRVTPVVARIDPDYVARPDPREVSALFEVPLAWLSEPGAHQEHWIEYQGRPRRVHAWVYGPHTIWGATAAMLHDFIERIRAA